MKATSALCLALPALLATLLAGCASPASPPTESPRWVREKVTGSHIKRSPRTPTGSVVRTTSGSDLRTLPGVAAVPP